MKHILDVDKITMKYPNFIGILMNLKIALCTTELVLVITLNTIQAETKLFLNCYTSYNDKY